MVWRPEYNVQESLLCHVCPGDRTLVIIFGSKCLYALSSLADPSYFMFALDWLVVLF